MIRFGRTELELVFAMKSIESDNKIIICSSNKTIKGSNIETGVCLNILEVHNCKITV